MGSLTLGSACSQASLVKTGWEAGLPWLRQAQAAPQGSRCSTCLQFLNKLWWLLILDYSLDQNVLTLTVQRKSQKERLLHGGINKKRGRRFLCDSSPTASPSIPSSTSQECLFLLTGPGHDQPKKILNLAIGTNSWNSGATTDTEEGEKVTLCFYLFVPHSTHLKGEGSTRSGLRFYLISLGSSYFSSLF